MLEELELLPRSAQAVAEELAMKRMQVSLGVKYHQKMTRIERIDVYQIDLPYAGGSYMLSGGRTYQSFDATLVRITADDGSVGWGESTPFGSNYVAAHAAGVRAGIAEMAPGLIGHDPRLVDRVNDAMDELLSGHFHAKTAIDVACWDLFGKNVGMPVCDLLGGRTNDRLPLVSSVHAGAPEDMRDRVAEYRALGYRGHSLKIGATEAEGGPSLDVDRVRSAMADAQSGEYFILDANGGLTVESALRFLRLVGTGLDFVLEAPCATWTETVTLARRTDVPIIVDELVNDEATVTQMVAQGVGEGIGLKISKNGGLTRCRRQRDISIAAGMTMSVQDTVGSEVSFAAIVHLGQTVPPKYLRGVLDVRAMVSVSTAKLDVVLVDGGVAAPNQPGLGVDVDVEVLGEPTASWG